MQLTVAFQHHRHIESTLTLLDVVLAGLYAGKAAAHGSYESMTAHAQAIQPSCSHGPSQLYMGLGLGSVPTGSFRSSQALQVCCMAHACAPAYAAVCMLIWAPACVSQQAGCPACQVRHSQCQPNLRRKAFQHQRSHLLFAV